MKMMRKTVHGMDICGIREPFKDPMVMRASYMQ